MKDPHPGSREQHDGPPNGFHFGKANREILGLVSTPKLASSVWHSCVTIVGLAFPTLRRPKTKLSTLSNPAALPLPCRRPQNHLPIALEQAQPG